MTGTEAADQLGDTSPYIPKPRQTENNAKNTVSLAVKFVWKLRVDMGLNHSDWTLTTDYFPYFGYHNLDKKISKIIIQISSKF